MNSESLTHGNAYANDKDYDTLTGRVAYRSEVVGITLEMVKWGEIGYNTRVNHIKSGQMFEASTRPFSTDVRGIDTMTHSIPNQSAQSNIPYGYCHCGCGQLAPLARATDPKKGWIKGQPVRFVSRHYRTTKPRELLVQPELPPGTRVIQLTQGKFTVVDADDYEYLSQFNWYAKKDYRTYYAVRAIQKENGKKGSVRMHQVLVGKGADHIDGNGLNNTRANLRPATNQQNRHNQQTPSNNTSGYKGVSFVKSRSKWEARIKFNGKLRHLGHFAAVRDAALAYNAAASELFGEFARLNEVGG